MEPENGKTVVTTIDSNIQKLAEDQLSKFEKKYGSKGSSILVMNPNNGEIYAMANSISYNLESPRDDKNLLKKYSQSQVNKMSEKEKTKAFNEIWKNPIVSNAFEPGSTYKPFTVAAGLEEGILKGNETYYCDGYQKVGPHTIHCSHRSGHGLITLSQSISLSCNDALMQIAAKEGKNVFARYQKNFNFGNKTGIDLPGEAQTASLLHDAKDMTAADLATSSFGQSFNCSMIQMGSAFCSLINGGNYYKPHVVKQLRSSNGEVVILSSKLAPNLMGAIAVSAYSYMALVPVIQPPIMRLLTTKHERVIRMKPPRAVSHTEKVIFPIIGLLLTCFLVPSGLPLLGMLFFGNLLKESGVTRRLANTASGPLIDTITILLGLTVGASTQASEFLTFDSIKIFALGALSFIIATASGVLFVKLFNLFLKKDNKINPLIGNAGVSAVPDSARISQVIGLEYDPTNYLLMHAMGPNVAGVIGSAVAAGILLGFLM